MPQRELKALQVEMDRCTSEHADLLTAAMGRAEADAAAHKKEMTQQRDVALQVTQHAVTYPLGQRRVSGVDSDSSAARLSRWLAML